MPPSHSSRLAPRMARVSCSRSVCPICSRYCQQKHSTGAWRALTSCNPSTRRPLVPVTTPRCCGSHTGRSVGCSASARCTFLSPRWGCGSPGRVGCPAIGGYGGGRAGAFPRPLGGLSVGWIFTEMGRQPWIVFGQMMTSSALSPNVTGLEVLISLVAFTLVYGVLAVVEVRLVMRAVKKGPPDVGEPNPHTGRVDPATTVY